MNTVITYIYSFFLKIKTTNFKRIYIIYILDKDIKFGFKKKPTLSISFKLSTTPTLLLYFKVNKITLLSHYCVYNSITILAEKPFKIAEKSQKNYYRYKFINL